MSALLPPEVTAALGPRGLRVSGGFAPGSSDGLPEKVRSLVLLSPSDDFWSIFTASHEYQGGAPHPMDRWSRRVIGRLACELGAKAYFPFGPKPAPFFAWAQRSGQAWPSPVKLLVGAEMGLNISYRGALGLTQEIDFAKEAQPCFTCVAPCTSACPAGALTEDGYDVPSCQDYLASHPEGPCRTEGCQVRRACPASSLQSSEHARFHMDSFLG
ncbi:MAG: ferredoxin [Pseudomonadota bacterium]